MKIKKIIVITLLFAFIIGSVQFASAGTFGSHVVWYDLNENGIFENGEPGADGITVELYRSDGTLVATDISHGGGYYKFYNVPAGTYYEKVIPPTGYMFTLKDQGSNEEIDSDVDQTGKTGLITITQDETYCLWKAGLIPQQTGNEGLTPGFWKTHPELWVGYSPDDKFNEVFGVSIAIDGNFNPTLMEALNAKGGVSPSNEVYDALARHAVAALLNAAHPMVDYPMTGQEIIDAVQDAIETGGASSLKATLEGYNTLGGGIDAHGNPI